MGDKQRLTASVKESFADFNQSMCEELVQRSILQTSYGSLPLRVFELTVNNMMEVTICSK